MWTYEKPKNIRTEYVKFLGNRKDNKENRNQFAKENLGRINNDAMMLDMQHIYPGTLHRCCCAMESVALRIEYVCQSANKSAKQFFNELNSSKIACIASFE